MTPQMQRYEALRNSGWEFSHNENGSIIMQLKGRTMESEWVESELEITKSGEVRYLPRDDNSIQIVDKHGAIDSMIVGGKEYDED